MASFILNSQSVLLCPHGAPISHVSSTYTAHRVQGSPPMLLTDTFVIAGCPNIMPMGSAMIPMPCNRVQWLTGSPMMLVKGSPVLTNQSNGLCLAANGAPAGPVIIASHQVMEKEPSNFTKIDD